MPPGIGYTFQPGTSDTPMQGQNRSPLSAPEAIRILSLRIPEQGRSPVPLPLLRGPGAGGGGMGSLDAVLQALMGAFSAQPGGGGSAAPSVPSAPQGGGGSQAQAPSGPQQPSSPGSISYPTPNITIGIPPNLGGNIGDTITRPGGPPPFGGTLMPFVPRPNPNEAPSGFPGGLFDASPLF